MSNGRTIAIFVEGDSERGDARRRTLGPFLHRWLDPQMPPGRKVGLSIVKFKGCSNFLDDVGDKAEQHLASRKANVVFGLVDLYGLPPNRIDFSKCSSVAEKVNVARQYIRGLIPTAFRSRFRQHFAVHELEAWLLADPRLWPNDIRAKISAKPPEEVNFQEPPARFLKRLLRGDYKKTTTAMNLFPRLDLELARSKCPYLKLLLDDLLRVAKSLS